MGKWKSSYEALNAYKIWRNTLIWTHAMNANNFLANNLFSVQIVGQHCYPYSRNSRFHHIFANHIEWQSSAFIYSEAVPNVPNLRSVAWQHVQHCTLYVHCTLFHAMCNTKGCENFALQIRGHWFTNHQTCERADRKLCLAINTVATEQRQEVYI